MIPGIKYASSGDLQIAYQVVGDGPVDIALAFDWGSNIELMWEHPQTERFLRRFASYGRLIFFDMRGVGLSDPVEDLPPLLAVSTRFVAAGGILAATLGGIRYEFAELVMQNFDLCSRGFVVQKQIKVGFVIDGEILDDNLVRVSQLQH